MKRDSKVSTVPRSTPASQCNVWSSAAVGGTGPRASLKRSYGHRSGPRGPETWSVMRPHFAQRWGEVLVIFGPMLLPPRPAEAHPLLMGGRELVSGDAAVEHDVPAVVLVAHAHARGKLDGEFPVVVGTGLEAL
jgi:hypothetical protein